jgi:hypothetical protein
MSTALAVESLLDEAEFVTELQRLEQGLAVAPKRISRALPALDAMADLPRPPKAPGVFAHDVERDDALDVPAARPSLLWRLTAAVAFVCLIGVGATGAAVVFHDQVSRLVAAWSLSLPR